MSEKLIGRTSFEVIRTWYRDYDYTRVHFAREFWLKYLLKIKDVNVKLSRIKVINVPKKPPRSVLSGYLELPIEKEISPPGVILFSLLAGVNIN